MVALNQFFEPIRIEMPQGDVKDELHEQEKYLIQMIQAIQEECIKQQKPYLERLAAIRNCRPQRFLLNPATNEMTRID